MIKDLAPLDAIPKEWRLTEKGKKAVLSALQEREKKYKYLSSLPIICKGKRCAFGETCYLLKSGEAPEGERCPLEIAASVDLFYSLCKELDVKEEDFVDATLIKQLIDIEIQLLRADRLLASDGNVIQHSVVAVNEKGEPIWRPDVHKAIELKDRLMKRKHEVLTLLNATRKDKAEQKIASLDPSVLAAELVARKKALEMEKGLENSIETRETEPQRFEVNNK